MSASMMKTSTRQAASARPSAAKRSVAPSAMMASAPRVAKASPAHSPSCPCCSSKRVARPSTVCAATTDVAIASKEYDLKWRQESVAQYFPSAITVDDFIARVETVLSGYGFTGENSIAMTNLCRDEVTVLLKDKIESAFGASFNTNGLGGVLTCGVTGMGAGLSHSPACVAGRERYVFFSFPHIGIDGAGNVGSISRPGRSGRSCACGALQKCLNEFRAEGYAPNCRVPGVHDPLDPEYSILKQRLARRLRYERQDTSQLTLASLTGVAERTITNDLEYLIEKSVDPKKADYAIVTGVQIHNWATNLNGDAPSMEFVAPTKVMVCVDGQKIHLDLTKVPSLSPRQLALLAAGNVKPEEMPRSLGPLSEVPYEYMAKRLGGGNSAPGGGAVVAPVAGSKMTIGPQYRAFQTTVEEKAYNISEENFSETFQAPSNEPHPSFDMSASQEEQVAALEKALSAGDAEAEPAKKKNSLWPF